MLRRKLSPQCLQKEHKFCRWLLQVKAPHFGLPLVEETLDPEIAVEELALPEGIAPLGPSQP